VAPENDETPRSKFPAAPGKLSDDLPIPENEGTKKHALVQLQGLRNQGWETRRREAYSLQVRSATVRYNILCHNACTIQESHVKQLGLVTNVGNDQWLWFL
jgi:hypothetical protein